jgi:deoxyadenosine/deoxycytidine kinase
VRPTVIVIEGQIGVGKTTLGEVLEEELELPLFKELTNPYTHEMLDRFYRDKKRWAFTLQVHFLNERFRKIKEIFENGGGLLDRSIFGDRIFAEVLHEDGDMEDFEFHTYRTLLENMLEHAQAPRLLIYLDCSVDTALDRIRKRNRGIESTIPRDYLARINERYLHWYEEYDVSPKVFIDTERTPLHTPAGRQEIVDQVKRMLGAPAR